MLTKVLEEVDRLNKMLKILDTEPKPEPKLVKVPTCCSTELMLEQRAEEINNEEMVPLSF